LQFFPASKFLLLATDLISSINTWMYCDITSHISWVKYLVVLCTADRRNEPHVIWKWLAFQLLQFTVREIVFVNSLPIYFNRSLINALHLNFLIKWLA
jgi:hypothetical protein